MAWGRNEPQQQRYGIGQVFLEYSGLSTRDNQSWWVQVSRKKIQALFKDFFKYFSAIFKDIFSGILGVSQ